VYLLIIPFIVANCVLTVFNKDNDDDDDVIIPAWWYYNAIHIRYVTVTAVFVNTAFSYKMKFKIEFASVARIHF